MRKTIADLCNFINMLDDIGCLLPEDLKEYKTIMERYEKIKKKTDDVIPTLQAMLAEVEWNYPLDYAEAVDTVIAAAGPTVSDQAETARYYILMKDGHFYTFGDRVVEFSTYEQADKFYNNMPDVIKRNTQGAACGKVTDNICVISGDDTTMIFNYQTNEWKLSLRR